jgi:hypothetical protein
VYKNKNVQEHILTHTDNNPILPFIEYKLPNTWHTQQFAGSPNSCCICTIRNGYKHQICLIFAHAKNFASNSFNNMVKVLALAAMRSSPTKQGSQGMNGIQISVTGTFEVM